jgi:hypothetical protein
VPGPGLGVICADFDGDGWPDIFISNDGQQNSLFINKRDGTFVEEGLIRGLALNSLGQRQANMGVAFGDVFGDSMFSIFVTHLSSERHELWRQESRGFFKETTELSGVAKLRWRGTGFGTVLADFNHDGELDLALVNGRVERNPSARPPTAFDPSVFWRDYMERNQLLVNQGGGRFRDVSIENEDFCGIPRISRALVCGDIDGDGALDLLVTNLAGPVRLYRNIAPSRGHWLMVRAVDPTLRRDAYGAEVTVSVGGRKRVSWVNPGYSCLCSNDPRAHFGLASAQQVDSIQVLWPDGDLEEFGGGTSDRVVVCRKGAGKPLSASKKN